MRLVTVGAALALTGCTYIAEVNVHTVAQDCDIERGQDQNVGAQADVNVLQQAGASAGQFIGSMRSRITCGDKRIEADTRGGTSEVTQ